MEMNSRKIAVFSIGALAWVLTYLLYDYYKNNRLDYLWNLIVCIPINFGYIINLYILKKVDEISILKFVINLILLLLLSYFFIYWIIVNTYPVSGYLLYFVSMPLFLLVFVLINKYIYNLKLGLSIYLIVSFYILFILLQYFFSEEIKSSLWLTNLNFYLFLCFLLTIVFPISIKGKKQ